MTLYASTKNAGKLREFLQASQQVHLPGFQIEPLPALETIAPPPETGSSFDQNSQLKACFYSQFTSGFVFADDSGLVVDALSGAPGVLSARYAGQHATDAENNALLLENLATIADRRARFICAITLAHRGRALHTEEAAVEGEILTTFRGVDGFGYDPLFFCPAFGLTFAELSPEQKFQVSHRGQAFRSLLIWIVQNQSMLRPQ